MFPNLAPDYIDGTSLDSGVCPRDLGPALEGLPKKICVPSLDG